MKRRHFSRVKFDADINLKFNEINFRGHLIDISLKGALIEYTDDIDLKKEDRGELIVTLGDSDIILKINVTVMYHNNFELGVRFGEMELETVMHLRRLVELNIGDSEKVRDELFFLVHTP